MNELENLARLVRKCRLHRLGKEIQAERDTHRYYFKSTRREELPRRYQAPAFVRVLLCLWVPGVPHSAFVRVLLCERGTLDEHSAFVSVLLRLRVSLGTAPCIRAWLAGVWEWFPWVPHRACVPGLLFLWVPWVPHGVHRGQHNLGIDPVLPRYCGCLTNVLRTTVVSPCLAF